MSTVRSPRVCQDSLRCVTQNRVVTLRHLNSLLISTGQNVETAITFSLQVLGAVQISDTRIFILSLEVVATRVWLIARVDKVIGGATLILLSSVVIVNFALQNCVYFFILHLPHLIPFLISKVSLFSQVGVSILFFVELLGSCTLISLRKILIEPFALCTQMSLVEFLKDLPEM